MPKRNQQPPLPAYGSDEWKAQRARMVGTPEWKAATGYDQIPNVDVQPGQTGGFVPPGSFGVFTPAGKTLTTAQKQLQNPLYNPLYDPHSDEYKANLVNISNPNPRRANPLVQNPLVQPPAYSPPQINSPTINTQPLQNAGPTQPTTGTPKITLPEMFQQNFSGPSAIPQGQGIKMPAIQRSQGFGGGNWTDFLTVAHNSRMR